MIFGTNNQHGVPVTPRLTFDGTAVDWGTARVYSMAPLSNSAESLDGKYRISDLDVTLIDTDGSVWAALGHGTTAFNKTFDLDLCVGGTMGKLPYSEGTKLHLLGTAGGATYAAHRGKITYAARRNRLVRVISKNNMRLIADMQWTPPFRKNAFLPDRIGTYFFSGVGAGGNFRNHSPNSVFDLNEEQNQYSVYAAIAPSSTNLEVAYPPIPGRKQVGLTSSVYTYPGTQFYFDIPRFKLTGTYIGTYVGTITTTDQANRYGFTGVAEAEAVKSGTRYVINKTRFQVRDGNFPPDARSFYYQQNLTLSGNPADILTDLLTSHAVTPYFGTADLDTVSFGEARHIHTFQEFSQVIDPDSVEVASYVKGLLTSVNSLFSANAENKFQLIPYGPKLLTGTVESIGASDIVDSRYENSSEDYYNRIHIKYAYSAASKEFLAVHELKGTGWTHDSDRPYEIESKWLRSANEVNVLAQRLLARHINTVPKVEVTTSLKYAGLGLGSLYSVTDEDSGLSGKIVQVVGYKKDFLGDRQVEITALDGEALFNRKGFGFWGAGTALPGVAVSGTSTFGWGTGGTVNNINAPIFGSYFSWF